MSKALAVAVLLAGLAACTDQKATPVGGPPSGGGANPQTSGPAAP